MLLKVHFTVPPQHYLYSDSLRVETTGPLNLNLNQPPHPTKKPIPSPSRTFGLTIRMSPSSTISPFLRFENTRILRFHQGVTNPLLPAHDHKMVLPYRSRPLPLQNRLRRNKQRKPSKQPALWKLKRLPPKPPQPIGKNRFKTFPLPVKPKAIRKARRFSNF